jgi:hypothetical protein
MLPSNRFASWAQPRLVSSSLTWSPKYHSAMVLHYAHVMKSWGTVEVQLHELRFPGIMLMNIATLCFILTLGTYVQRPMSDFWLVRSLPVCTTHSQHQLYRDVVDGPASRLVRFTRSIRMWLGHRTGLHATEESKISCLCRELNLQSSFSQPVA